MTLPPKKKFLDKMKYCQIIYLPISKTSIVNSLFLEFSFLPFYLVCFHARTSTKWNLHIHFCGTIFYWLTLSTNE